MPTQSWYIHCRVEETVDAAVVARPVVAAAGSTALELLADGSCTLSHVDVCREYNLD